MKGDGANGKPNESKESEDSSHPKDLEQLEKGDAKEDAKEESKRHDGEGGPINPDSPTLVETDGELDKKDKHKEEITLDAPKQVFKLILNRSVGAFINGNEVLDWWLQLTVSIIKST